MEFMCKAIQKSFTHTSCVYFCAELDSRLQFESSPVLRKYVSKLTLTMQPCVTQILPMSGVCGEHDTVWLSGCWFGLHKPTGRMQGKVIWLLDYGYFMGSTFFIYLL